MTYEPEEIPCIVCGDPTIHTGTRNCNRCWELKVRIRNDKDIAIKIVLAELGPLEVMKRIPEEELVPAIVMVFRSPIDEE